MKKLSVLLLVALFVTGCGGKNEVAVNTQDTVIENTQDTAVESTQDEEAEKQQAKVLEDGEYTAVFTTDSSMFHVNEAKDGKGELTVVDGQMMLHISMPSKNIVNLYLGLAEEAQAEGAILLEPTVDTVTYSDGMTEEVNGFDIPVPALDEEFDLALIGTKGVWYDHKVSVSLCE